MALDRVKCLKGLPVMKGLKYSFNSRGLKFHVGKVCTTGHMSHTHLHTQCKPGEDLEVSQNKLPNWVGWNLKFKVPG